MLINESISVLGLPGCGKSTFVKALKVRNPEFNLIMEPMTPSLKTQLESFYRGEKGAAYNVQVSFVDAWVETLKSAPQKLILDASPLAVRSYILAQQDLSILSVQESCKLLNYYNSKIHSVLSFLPSKYIYLKTHPSVALYRSRKRNRDYENLTLPYLEALNKHFEHLVLTLPDVVVIDNDVEKYTTTCPECRGSGFSVVNRWIFGAIQPVETEDCFLCNGTGEYVT